jgi:phosphoribosylformimino-5-aminoimidazole carboxamide ribotide isomerase
MLIFPAIDLYEGKAVRLLKGDYRQMTVYEENPARLLTAFADEGAKAVHVVDLEGARDGQTPNLKLISDMKAGTGLFMQVGGGVRTMDIISRYLEDARVDRVIIGTAAVTDPNFVEQAVRRYEEKIAVGVDIRDGKVAIRGWTADSGLEAFAFCRRMQELGVKTLVCTDISKDGAMKGTNPELYKSLSENFSPNVTASGGVSSLEDVKTLRTYGLYGAIIGKAYYVGAIDLKEAIEAAK